MKYQFGWAFPDCDDFMIHELKADGGYQADHLRAALAHVTNWDLAIDGGAHVGTWSRLLAARFTRVIACEPSADTFEALVENMRANDCPNVTCRPIALGESAGRVSMVLDGRGAALHNTGARWAGAGEAVPRECIDDWALPSLGFLKLDVEGSEPMILRGAAQTLRRCRPIVLFEDKYLWKRFGLPRDAPRVILRELGYQPIVRAGIDEIWGPR
jgi:FkbM family methyltransferase